MVVGWAAGPAGERLTGKPREEIARRALETLARWFGTSAAALESQLDGYDVADWGADPFARGGYMWVPVGQRAATAALAASHGALHFAGEATHAGDAGTVHGAVESGERAAREILRAGG